MSDKIIILVCVLLGLGVFGGLLGGYVLTDLAFLDLENWWKVILFRFLIQGFGVFCFFGIFIYFGVNRTVFSLTGLALVLVLNVNPIRDLVKQPVTVDQPSVDRITIERYANLSSDYDFSTARDPFVRLRSENRMLVVEQEDWAGVMVSCSGRLPVSVTGLYYMKKLLDWECGPPLTDKPDI